MRKIRWRQAGKGKRGGVRIVYLYLVVQSTVYLLTIYAKSQQDDLSSDEKKAIRRVVEELKEV